jgi:hypothetical protein
MSDNNGDTPEEIASFKDDFEKRCHIFGLSASDFGKSVIWKDREYVVAGIRANSMRGWSHIWLRSKTGHMSSARVQDIKFT